MKFSSSEMGHIYKICANYFNGYRTANVYCSVPI